MAPATEPSENCLRRENVTQAVSALFQVLSKQETAEKQGPVNKKRKLLDDDGLMGAIELSLFVKKIPQIRSRKMIRIHLPHSITSDAIRICLLVKDLKLKDSDNDETNLHFKEFLASKDIDFISEVLSLHQLRTEYQTYEAKRKLCHAYDLFIADQDLECYLPKMLGKEFLLKRKMPSKVNMRGKNLKVKLEEIRDSTHLYLHEQGDQFNLRVGLTKQREDQVEDNIMAVADMIKRFLPGGWDNIRGLHIRAKTTMNIPIYVSLGSSNDIVLKPPFKRDNTPAVEELSTIKKGRVAVYPDGFVKVIHGKQSKASAGRNAKRTKKRSTRATVLRVKTKKPK